MDDKIGLRIREMRISRGLSQRDIASDNITHAYISRIEKGERFPSAKVLRDIADKLGVSAHYLESGANNGTCPHCLQEVKAK